MDFGGPTEPFLVAAQVPAEEGAIFLEGPVKERRRVPTSARRRRVYWV